MYGIHTKLCVWSSIAAFNFILQISASLITVLSLRALDLTVKQLSDKDFIPPDSW